ncbi:MAG: gamma-butyrobetaine hydroxylase-like domain-containing protein [Candidatus Dormibacteria bacterium]
MATSHRPTRFSYDEAQRALVVDWDDGARLAIPFVTLRRACPCALCSGEMGYAGRFAEQPELLPGEEELADVHLVGAYGLNPIWSNGHDTGIYTFEVLRRLGEATAGSG